jgi:hypothetical protein
MRGAAADEPRVRNQREKFARAMAHAAFGRHYWDDDREAERRADRKRPKKPER